MTLIHNGTRTYLTILCLLMAALLTYLMLAPLRPIDVPRIDMRRNAVLASNVQIFSLPPIQTYASINARPLFNPQRQPVAMDITKAGAGNGTAVPSLVLFGTLIDRHTRMAFLKSQTSQFATAAHIGDIVEGWTVVAIVLDRVTLANSEHRFEIMLNAAKPAAPPTSGLLKPGNSTSTKIPEQIPSATDKPPQEVQDMLKNIIKSQTISNSDSKDKLKKGLAQIR